MIVFCRASCSTTRSRLQTPRKARMMSSRQLWLEGAHRDHVHVIQPPVDLMGDVRGLL
jgi:hypothetical protein